MSPRVSWVGWGALVLCSGAAPARTLVPADIANIREVAHPALDPSGRWVAYDVSQADLKADKSFSHVWMTSWDGAQTVQLTYREKESESLPRWSPDGRYLAFISSRNDKHDSDQLWLLNRAGGEARAVTKLAGSVVDYVWSPNGREIAMIVMDPDPNAEDDSGQDEGATDGKAKDDKPPKPIVIDRFQFKRDIDGYLGNRRQRLTMLDVDSGKTRRLTAGEYDEYLPAFSPDGKQIAFVSNRDPDPDRSYNMDLWLADSAGTGQAPRRLTTFAGSDNDPDYESYPAWSPDGRTIAYVQGGPVELFSYGTRKLATVAAAGGTPRILSGGLDRNVSNPRWSANGRSLQVVVEDDAKQWLGTVASSGGAVRRVVAGDRTVVSGVDQAPKLRTVALGSDPSHPEEVYAIEGGSLRRLTHQNDAWLADVQLAPVEETNLRSRDGTEVHGFLLRPVNGNGSPAPTILRIHGGPQSQYDRSFNFEWQLFAGNGYAVVAANPRGSTGRGQDYAKGIYAAWGTVDVADVLAAADDAVRRRIADPNRLGVGGWSYGGILTNYVIASDPRFRAATSGASISNVLAGYGTDQYIRDYEMELGTPWQHLDRWVALSYPFFHVDRISTATLFLAGDQDFNVPLLNSEQMYQALKSRGIPTQLIIYPGQFHGLKRPSFLIDRGRRYLDWYGKYLKQ